MLMINFVCDSRVVTFDWAERRALLLQSLFPCVIRSCPVDGLLNRAFLT